VDQPIPPDPSDPDGSAPTRDTPLGPDLPPAAPEPTDPIPPFRLDQFEIRRQIGKGGQGFVYEAFDHDLDRSAAVKIVLSCGQDSGTLDRFEREAKALARLDHPNIVTIYTSKATSALGKVPARYFAMEYIPAALSITDYAQEHNLSLHQRVNLVRLLCLALEAGHRQGIFHRDLKPTNLLVGKDGVPRVIDFGLASGPSVSDDDGAQRAREQGTAVGTPCYMSPEQFSGDPDLIDESSDIYGMGVVLYEVLTGHLPYPVLGKHWREVGEIVREHPPDPPRRFHPGLDTDLIAIVNKALEKEPGQRFASMQEFAEDLGRWQAGEHPTARIATPVSRLGAMVRRNAIARPKLSLAVCVMLSVVIASVFVRGFVADILPLNGWLQDLGTKARAAIGEGPGELTMVRGVLIDEEGMGELADRLGMEGVVPGEPLTYRELHGWIMTRLAEVRPSVVAFDIAFGEADNPGDDAMVSGIEKLRNAGCQVVFAHPDWPKLSGERRPLDADIIAGNRVGVPTGEFLQTGWRIDTAVELPDEILATPSFSLVAFMAMRYPDMPFFMTRIDIHNTEVVLTLGEAYTGVAQSAGIEHRAGVSFVRRDIGKHQRVDLASRVAYSDLDVPPVEIIKQATLNARDLLDLTSTELRDRFHQKVVVIGQSIPGHDWHAHPEGVMVEGFKVQMVAVQALITGAPPRHATPPQHLLAMLGGGLLGLVIVSGNRRSWRRGLIAVGGASVAVIALSPVIFATGLVFVGPLPVVAAMVLTFLAASWVCKTRTSRGYQSWAHLRTGESNA